MVSKHSVSLLSRPVLGRLGLIGGLALASCATATLQRSELDVVRDLIRHGQFREAVYQSEQLRQDRPSDPEAELLHRDASVAYLLARGREKTFQNRDDDALMDFGEALALDSESQQVKNWIDKTHHKLADAWFERARAMHANENLEGALAAYETALGHVPEHKGAREGLFRVGIQQNYRAGLSDTYYNEGLRAIQEWRLDEAKHRFEGSGKYGGQTDRVRRRVSEVDRQIAVSRVIVAKDLESRGLFAAARNDYRTAKELDPENEEAAVGYTRARNEAEVARQLSSGRQSVLRGDFAHGRAEMEAALASTEVQQEAIQAAIDEIQVAQAGEAYQAALDLEHDFQYEAAATAYQHVIDTFGYDLAKDSQARITTLTDYVSDAAELYAEAREADTLDARRDLLRQITVFWPEYRDIQKQLDALGE